MYQKNKNFIAGFLQAGMSPNLKPYERKRVLVFNICNLGGFVIDLIRVGYLAGSKSNTYTPIALFVNALPILLCAIMAFFMNKQLYKQALTFSFTAFPPVLVIMGLYTNDGSIEIYLLLYMMFTFFFLHKISYILASFSWVLVCFIVVHFCYNSVFVPPYAHDGTLTIINYVAGLIFIFLTMYFIKFQVWNFEKSLHKKKEDLKKLNAVKDKVFSVISHDLRTPVNSIVMMLRALEEETMTMDDFYNHLPLLRSSMEQTNDMLGNLLAWSRTQIKQEGVNAKPISVKMLAKHTIRFLERPAAEKNIYLINEISSDLYAFADEGSAEIILRNLMANAIKFTASGGVIKVKAQLQGKYVSIIVEDNGIGIPKDKQPLLFGDVYYSSKGTNKESGTGLGLLICRELVEKNGGHLLFESTPGNGSIFSFSLPACIRDNPSYN